MSRGEPVSVIGTKESPLVIPLSTPVSTPESIGAPESVDDVGFGDELLHATRAAVPTNPRKKRTFLMVVALTLRCLGAPGQDAARRM